MLPAVVLVGRPNVGKSTLFNQLTRSRDALVADYPGLTRDRRYGFGQCAGRQFLLIDTGGLAGPDEQLAGLAARQTELALQEADAVVFVVDHRSGLTAADREIAARLRRSGKPVTIAVNKSEGVAAELAEAEFHGLGCGVPVGVAALHGRGLETLTAQALGTFEPAPEEPEVTASPDGPMLAVVGRPNVGKSTLINRLLRAERLVTSAEPGTTRDSIIVPCERNGRAFSLVDTAGLRRRARVSEWIEKYSIVQTLQAIENASVVVLLLDAREGVTEQDLHLIGLVLERGRAMTIGVNKWDGLSSGRRRAVERQIDRRLDFVPFVDLRYVSALHGSGIEGLLDSAFLADECAGRDLATPLLNRILEDAVRAHPPPILRGRQPRLRYAHQGGRRPPLIVVHGSQADRLPAHYRRYLANAFMSALRLRGTPVRVELKSGGNPYAGRRNELTKRQQRRKQRIRQHGRRRR